MDKTLEAAAWLYKNNREFTNLKTAEARLLMDGTMAIPIYSSLQTDGARPCPAPFTQAAAGYSCLPLRANGTT